MNKIIDDKLSFEENINRVSKEFDIDKVELIRRVDKKQADLIWVNRFATLHIIVKELRIERGDFDNDK
ncbi:MAG: hypothetical protein ACTSPV_12450 [Candidatus Hodarchaeales archaeon]